MKNFILALVLLPMFFAMSYSQQSLQEVLNKSENNFHELSNAFESSWDNYPDSLKKGGWKQFKRWEYFWKMRTYPNGEFPDATIIYKEWHRAQKEHKRHESMQSEYEWELLGPKSAPSSISGIREQGIGRVNRLRINPKNSNEIWAGTASGGVWKSTDKGVSWKSMDFTSFLSLGVSDIAISPTDPKIVYVATGDIEPAYSKNFYTIGLIKTTDGGNTWALTAHNYELEQGRQVGAVLVHPEDADYVIIGTNDGIYVSTDGGDSWDKKLNEGYFVDLEFMPDNPEVVYGSTMSYSGNSTIYRSEDGGQSWETSRRVSNGLRIALAVTKDEPDYVYALSAYRSTRGFNSFLVSTDRGETWNWEITRNDIPNILGWYKGTGNDLSGQGSYDLSLAVDPNDGDEVFSGGINIWKSKSLGYDWELTSHWNGSFGEPYVHADIHDLVFTKNGDALYAAHDGGIDVSYDNGLTWNFISNGISNTQYYRIGSAQSDPEIVYGGCQDNGTSRYYKGEWHHIYAGDGMECIVDPINADRVYVSMYYGRFYRSVNGGVSFGNMINENVTGNKGAWVTPLVISPSNPKLLFAGYEDVWMSDSYGTPGTWDKISDFGISSKLYSMAVSPSDPDYIYACTLGTIFYTYNGGETWQQMGTPSGAISYITVDPNNPERFWISISSYTESSKVYEYDGSDFINLSGNLPNVPVNCVIYQKNSPDRLFVGTDLGVYYSDYGSAIWNRYGKGLPNVVVNELEIQENAQLIRAGTYGRGIWEAPLIDCNLPQPKVTVLGETSICQGDEVVLEAEEGYENYTWNTGETTRSITVSEEGAYAVTVDDGGDCKARSEAIHVEVNYVPELDVIVRGDNPFCQGDSLQLSAGFGFEEYEWSTGESGRSIYVKEPGEYYVTGVTSDDCEAEAEPVMIEMIPTEKPQITQSDNILTSTPAESYQWYFEGEPIEGAILRKLEIEETGVYHVLITDENGCEVLSDPIDVLTDVEDAYKGGEFLGIHPNPNKGSFTLNIMLPYSTEYQLSIVNILGKTLYADSYIYDNGFKTKELNINLPSGIYFVHIRYGNGNIIEKMIIE